MGVPALPKWQPQGPASRCVYKGVALGWLNCTPTSFAMAIDRSTLHAVHPTGCDVRVSTGDTSGGTTMAQCAPYAKQCGVATDVHAGSNVVSPTYVATQLRAGRSIVLQGNTKVLIGTKYRSTGSGVNHAIHIPAVRGGSLENPSEGLVYDPAADGHQAGWGKVAQGPQWWPWSLIVRFAHELHPWGEGDSRTLRSMGVNGVYATLFPDTEPHAHFHYGAVRTSPFPDRTRVNRDALWSHKTPSYGVANRISPRLHRDDLFVAYQKVNKAGIWWLGSHDGNRWVPQSKMRNVGGSE